METIPNLQKSFVLITGASSGIGEALAFEFAAYQQNLLLVALPDTGLEGVCLELKTQFGIEVNTLCTDLTLPGSAAGVLHWCQINFFKVSVLVNNAGFGNLELFENSNPDLLCNMMELNNRAVIMLTHLFLPELRKFKQSYIMNVGSLASFIPIPGKSVYAASKSFVYAFSQSLYLELKTTNIHVSCLCPGGTMTPKVQSFLSEMKFKRKGFCQLPEEVAKVAVRQLYKRKFRIVPGFQNQFLYWLSQILPMPLKIMIIQSVFKKSSPPPSRMYPQLSNRSSAVSFALFAR